ncbi:thermonuclease family protein [Rhizobium leguminosarum]|uniref:thermonuclease family protein n=1 Tax=Rhizobium leguminosarum TaxID=384 RepID=UPI000CF54BF3|nr:thermonuclease family protein [Rhizobium leguminosarum]
MGKHLIISTAAITAACLGSGISVSIALGSPATTTTDDARPSYGRCGTGPRVNCIVDGDTLWSNGVKIRVADIDTPEISQPNCAAEKALGEQATLRLIELVNIGPFAILAWRNRDKDRNGRELRVLVRGGRSLGDILVSEGLARTWTGRRQPWC